MTQWEWVSWCGWAVVQQGRRHTDGTLPEFKCAVCKLLLSKDHYHINVEELIYLVRANRAVAISSVFTMCCILNNAVL